MTFEIDTTYKDLRRGLSQLARLGVESSDPADTTDERQQAQDLVDLWLPLAETRLREAAESPSDQARWRKAIQGVAPPEEPNAEGAEAEGAEAEGAEAESDFVAFLSGARVLLRCLLDAERPGPQVVAIADRVRKLIKDGEYPAGSWLNVSRIATEAGCMAVSVERARVALRDLEAEGLITFNPSSSRPRVVGEAKEPDQPTRIAGWLRVLIAEGVYPPYSNLPTGVQLARALATQPRDVTAAMRILATEKILNYRPNMRRLRKPWPPTDVAPPPEIADLAQKLRGLVAGDLDLSPSNVRIVCQRARNWWRCRITPPVDQLEVTFRTLVGAASHLFTLLETRPAYQDMDTLLRRTAVTALVELPDDFQERVWRTACLAVAVLELQEVATALARRREYIRQVVGPDRGATGGCIFPI
ncbi:GntR family transcriptional regulator [Streptomyces sp. SID4985]|uniref:GntR family transcriptional regulator n=1 Tax=Streptomyces sp. SID4985 TaxID=2690292 RepID=UPI001370F487|nr:GntR family transcriptional regulator [Streptomyces sp. SID4985]MYQ48775.1 GntR family transcriptional regulator [Streptomyces sp. SID4985]